VPKGFIKVHILKVYDGDTVWFGVDFKGTPMRFKLRLAWIDTKEIRKKQGDTPEEIKYNRFLADQAKHAVDQICMSEDVFINIIELGNFKRFVGELYAPMSLWSSVVNVFDINLDEEYTIHGKEIEGVKCLDVGSWLLRSGLATKYQKNKK
jgi:endonuclease YncB( thermonuclease family)